MLVGAGRVADVAEAGGPGPQTHHQKRRGLAQWEEGEDARAPGHWALPQEDAGKGQPQAPSGPVDARAGSPGAMLWPPPAQAIRGAESPRPAHSGIEAALFPSRAGLWPVPILGDRVMEGEEKGVATPALPGPGTPRVTPL